MLDLEIGKGYRIYYIEFGSEECKHDYGVWKFAGAASGKLWFENSRGAGFSIPKNPAIMAPADRWVVKLDEGFVGE
jgi:hypothetical protein